MTMADDPKTLYLPFWIGGEFNLAKLIASDGRWSWSVGYRLLELFELHSHERDFVRTLLARRTNLWLFRTNQRQACGDFVIVDMSAATPESRRAFVVELKAKELLVVGGARLQCASWRAALEEIAATTGIVDASTHVELLYGDAAAVLAHLGVG